MLETLATSPASGACGNAAAVIGARPDAGSGTAAYAREMMSGYDMTGWSWFGMAMMVIGTIAIVSLVAWVVSSARPRDGQRLGPSAREVLDRRLAGGETDTKEYRERIEALRDDHAHAP